MTVEKLTLNIREFQTFAKQDVPSEFEIDATVTQLALEQNKTLKSLHLKVSSQQQASVHV